MDCSVRTKVPACRGDTLGFLLSDSSKLPARASDCASFLSVLAIYLKEDPIISVVTSDYIIILNATHGHRQVVNSPGLL
jgi:hypothetical protein